MRRLLYNKLCSTGNKRAPLFLSRKERELFFFSENLTELLYSTGDERAPLLLKEQ